jgi:enoyl-[acyl-carrier protein] reductase II
MLRTEICDYFGIEYPIVLAGMGGVSMHRLAAAVSNAGGLGVLGGAGLDPQQLRAEIRATRELTDKPFAVDLLAPLPQMIRPHLPVMIEEGVKIFVAGLAVPEQFISTMHEHGMKVVVMCGKVRHAQKAEAAGADAVVAQGTEAGGHTGEIGALALIPQVRDAVRIPVLAAGGISDGRGIAAALSLGASAVVIGTRFIATFEAQAAEGYRAALVRATDDSTTRTRCYTGKPARCIRNPYIAEWEKDPSRIKPFPEQLEVSYRNRVLDYSGAHGDVDPSRTFMPGGQGAGLIRQIEPAAKLFARLVEETEAVIRRLQHVIG